MKRFVLATTTAMAMATGAFAYSSTSTSIPTLNTQAVCADTVERMQGEDGDLMSACQNTQNEARAAVEVVWHSLPEPVRAGCSGYMETIDFLMKKEAAAYTSLLACVEVEGESYAKLYAAFQDLPPDRQEMCQLLLDARSYGTYQIMDTCILR